MTVQRFLGLLICWITAAVPAFAQDRFAPAFPKVVFEQWVSAESAVAGTNDELRRATLIGRSVVRTYETRSGQRQLELMLTENGEIYDVAEFLDLGSVADAYIPESVQIAAGRVIWAAFTRNEPYLRSVVAPVAVRVESSYLGSKEQQILQFFNEAGTPDIGMFYLTLADDGTPMLASESGNAKLSVFFSPTLDLVLQGQSTLYRDYLVAKLKSRSDAATFDASPFYALKSNANGFSIALPEVEYYRNTRSFVRDGSGNWRYTGREQLAIPEGRIAGLVSHRWATLALPASFRFRDVAVSADYKAEVAVEGKSVERFTMNGAAALDWIGDVLGKGQPAYYNTLGAARDGDEVVVRGIWLVKNPELAYEHVFRISDIFRIGSSGEYEWARSEIRMVLAARTDNVNALKMQPPPSSGQAPVFRIKVD